MKNHENASPVLEVQGLKQYFRVSRTYTVKAVEDVSFKIYPGETYGLVGESGSGKSTIGRSVIRLYEPTDGKITFAGKDISGKISKADNKTLRTQMQMIFQDPMASLNPRKKVEDILGEGLDIHHMYANRAERKAKIQAILAKVGLAPEHAARYPHQFSGGQRQRVGIARAMIMNPKLIIADECISALDVSIQAQVVNLMKDIQEETENTYPTVSVYCTWGICWRPEPRKRSFPTPSIPTPEVCSPLFHPQIPSWRKREFRRTTITVPLVWTTQREQTI